MTFLRHFHEIILPFRSDRLRRVLLSRSFILLFKLLFTGNILFPLKNNLSNIFIRLCTLHKYLYFTVILKSK